MDWRLLFSGLALEFGLACWPLYLLVLSTVVDYSTTGQLYLFFAEGAAVLTAVSIVFVIFGILRNGVMTRQHGQLLVVLSVFAFLGTLISSSGVVSAASWASMDCGPSTVSKCYMVQAGTYVSFYFFPAIAIPIITFVFGLANKVQLERLHSTASTA